MCFKLYFFLVSDLVLKHFIGLYRLVFKVMSDLFKLLDTL